MVKDRQVPPELEDLAEKIGDFIQYWGFKKIHGRIWTHIFLAEEPLDAQTLICRLKVSKALMSFSLNDLLGYSVIEEAGKSARNTQLYRVNTDFISVILNVLRRREKRLLTTIEGSFRAFKDLPITEQKQLNVDPERVRCLGLLIKEAQSTLAGMLSLQAVDFKQWQEIFDEGPSFHPRPET